jgi:hypothetical protein
MLTVMENRGLRTERRDALIAMTRHLAADELEHLRSSTLIVERCGDDAEAIEVLVSAARSVSTFVAGMVRACELQAEPVTIFRWLVSGSGAEAKLLAAAKGDSEAREEFAAFIQLREAQVEQRTILLAEPKPDRLSVAPIEISETAVSRREPRPARKRGSLDVAKREGEVDWKPALQHKVFAGSAALTLEIELAATPEFGRKHTLKLEGAKRLQPAEREEDDADEQPVDSRRFDWDNKIVFQATLRELHRLAATLVGATPHFSAGHHGKDGDKGCEIKAQAGGVVVSLSQGRARVTVPIGQENLYLVGILAMRVLAMNDRDVDPKVLLDVLRLTTKSSKLQS